MLETNENETFDFITAIAYLKDGKRVRPVYAYDGFYYFLDSNKKLCDSSGSHFVCICADCFVCEWELV